MPCERHFVFGSMDDEKQQKRNYLLCEAAFIRNLTDTALSYNHGGASIVQEIDQSPVRQVSLGKGAFTIMCKVHESKKWFLKNICRCVWFKMLNFN